MKVIVTSSHTFIVGITGIENIEWIFNSNE